MVYLGASYFMDKIKREEISDKKLVIVSPDCNGVPRAKKFRDILEMNGVEASFGFIANYLQGKDDDTYIGESVKDKDVIIVDDMIHSGSTLAKTTKVMDSFGAANIYSFITHNLLYQQSFQKVENLPIAELVTTNTLTSVSIN